MSEIINIAIVDDEKLFVNGLRLLLEDEKEFNVQFTANDGQELLSTLTNRSNLPDIILLDLKMKPMDGLEATQHLQQDYPEVKIVILSTYYREAFIGQMIKLGVSAFLPKNIDIAELTFALKTVAEKGLYFTQDMIEVMQGQIMGKRIKSTSFEMQTPLTSREKEVLTLICEQYMAQEIADKLHISSRTVDGHRNNLLLKTDARNIVGLVVYGILNGYVDTNEKLLEYTLKEN